MTVPFAAIVLRLLASVDVGADARVALISAASAVAVALVAGLFPFLSKSRADKRREDVRRLREDSDRHEGSFARLERENVRLNGQVRELYTELASERAARKLEEAMHTRTADDCAEMKRTLQRLGHMPPTRDENGDPR